MKDNKTAEQPLDERQADDQARSTSASMRCPLGWWRMTLLILLLNSTFFYHGCDSGNFHFSIGAVAPFLAVAVENANKLPSHIVGVSPVALIVNLLSAIAILWAIDRFFPRLARGLASRIFFVALSLSVATVNSFLVSLDVWSYVTWWPTLQVIAGFERLLFDSTDSSTEVGRLDVVLGSRMYFLLLLGGLYLILRLGATLLNRYVFVAPQRWWQFQLGGLMAIAVFLGTAIGLLVRILRQSG